MAMKPKKRKVAAKPMRNGGMVKKMRGGGMVQQRRKSKQVRGEECLMASKGLYANINAKKKRIKAGSNEKMRKPGTKGAPTAKAFKRSAKTANKKR